MSSVVNLLRMGFGGWGVGLKVSGRSEGFWGLQLVVFPILVDLKSCLLFFGCTEILVAFLLLYDKK